MRSMGHNKQERKRKEKDIEKKKTKKEEQKKRKQGKIGGDDADGDNRVQEARLFPHLLGLFFLLKYSFRRAMLQPEFGESKPDESQSEQSIAETRKAASCSSETLKSNADSEPAGAGCPVSNPDNLWKSPLLSRNLSRCCEKGLSAPGVGFSNFKTNYLIFNYLVFSNTSTTKRLRR